MRINHNIAALNTYRQLSSNTASGTKSLEKLSSGLRINRAGDDAAGLAISEKMRSQIRGLDQASRNAQDGISLIQTAEGALNETHSILQRMRELAVQSATDTNTSSDRGEIQKEVDQLATEVTRISNDTEFNTQKLLNGGITTDGIGKNVFQIGANAGQSLSIDIAAMDAKTLGISRDSTASATGVAGVDADLASATFAGTTFGAGITNGNVATITYTGPVTPVSAEAATVTGVAALATDVSASTDVMTITVDGTAYTLSNADVQAADGLTGDQLAAHIADKAVSAGAVKLSTVADLSFSGGNLTIDSKSKTAASTVAISYNAGDGAMETMTGLADGATDTGVTAVAAAAARYSITSTGGQAQTVIIADPTATSLTINTGNFQGMTLNANTGKTLADISGATVTMTTTSNVASAATFSDHALTAAAVTNAGIDVSTQANANIAIGAIEAAITTVSSERAKMGSVQNRLEHTINNLGTTSENMTAAESRIRDVDMAKEMMEFTKTNILSQAATSMLAQANQQPQNVLKLLQ